MNSSDDIKTRVTGHAGVTSASELFNNSISDSAEESNNNFGLRSRFPDLTEADRQATAREQAQREMDQRIRQQRQETIRKAEETQRPTQTKNDLIKRVQHPQAAS